MHPDFDIWGVRSHTHASAHALNVRDVLKKARLVWLKKLQSVRQIARLKQQLFLSFPFYIITQRSYEKIKCIYFLFDWFSGWKLLYIYTFFTQRTPDLDRLERNMDNETIVFVTSLLTALTWNILLLFSFWQKIISYFR